MDCACVPYDSRDSAGPEFYRKKVITANKVHRCTECGRFIGIGEKYEYVSGYWDGDFDTFKTCADCLSIFEAMFCDGREHGSMFEYLEEHIDNMYGDISEDCLTGMTTAARARVCEMIEDAWERFPI